MTESINVEFKFLMNVLDLKMYEAAKGDLSLCKDDKRCISKANEIKSWFCAISACDDKNKKVSDCFKDIPQEVKVQLDQLICPSIKSPSLETRQALLHALAPYDVPEENIIAYQAYVLSSMKGAVACQDYIKNYVGAYGSKWNSRWYTALSGCSILAGKSTREQEEKDFYTWFGVEEGLGNCSGIVNSELNNACNTPGAASPKPAP